MQRVPSRLVKGVEWETRYYRLLSHYISLRWNTSVGEEIHRVLRRFEVPRDVSEERAPDLPGQVPEYSVLDRGPRAKPRYHLLYGEDHWMGSNTPVEMIDNMMWHIQNETFRRSRDFLLIHAGSVRTPSGKALVMPASMESGKTTLTAGLVRAGFAYLSDEAAAIDPVTRLVYPFAKPLTIKEGSFSNFPELRPSENGYGHDARWFIQPDDIRPDAVGEPCPIGFVVAPRYEEDNTTELTRISRAAGLVQLAQNSLNLHIYQTRGFFLLADAIRKASCYRMAVGDLDEAVSQLIDLTSKRTRRT